jgi:hypothetical protein
MKVLANDGISKVESSFRKGGFEVTTKVAQEQV